MEERRQVRLGLVGFGDVGSAIGRGLREQGLEEVLVYDKFAEVEPAGQLIRDRAAKARVRLASSFEELAEGADLIVAATQGSASVAVADSLRPHLRPRHAYVDIAAAAPSVKTRAGAVLESTGASLGDGAIMGSPLEDGHRLLILASGPAAVRFRDGLTPFGMRINVVGEKLGAASAIKSLRSVFMKGMEALLVECILGSRRYGIEEQVLESTAEFLAGRPFMRTVNLLLTTEAVHAKRRAEEVDMSVDALSEVGIDPIMTRSTSRRLHWSADLGLREQFGGVVPQRYQQVIEAMEEKLGIK